MILFFLKLLRIPKFPSVDRQGEKKETAAQFGHCVVPAAKSVNAFALASEGFCCYTQSNV
tara:strand:- start:292 stop:471 length:180 start_codon:yes stop_codon:yes gene_type:complete